MKNKLLIYYLNTIKRHKIAYDVKLKNYKGILLGNNIEIGDRCIIKADNVNKKSIFIEDNVSFKTNCYLSAPNSRIKIGKHTTLGHNSWIGGAGDIEIGYNSLIGIHTVIISGNHDYMNIDIPFISVPEIAKPIIIGHNVWIGANCVILPGVSIGNGCVIAAGSVVTKDIKENTIVMGIPAKPYKELIGRNMPSFI